MNNSSTLPWILFVLALGTIAYMHFSGKGMNIKVTDNSPDSSGAQGGTEVKCELTDAYGRTITITGDHSDPQFKAMCQLQQNQQVYLYGYPYTFIRFHGGGHHGGHH